MSMIMKRVDRLESARKTEEGDLSLLTDAELDGRIDAVLERMGTSRERAIAEHGSLNGFRDYLEGQQHGND